MKFFNILALATFASAAPTALQPVEVRDNTVALEVRQATGNDGFGGAISAAVAELRSVTTQNLNSIRTAIERTRGAVSTEVIVEVQGIVQANFAEIAEALRTAGAAITAATVGSGANFQAIVAALTTGQVNNIRAAITDAVAIVRLIQTTLQGSATGIAPIIRQLIIDEVAALRAAFNAFIGPLQTFVQATQNAGNGAAVGVTGLAAVVQSLGSVVQNLVAGLGLPNLNVGGTPSTPSIPSLPNVGGGTGTGTGAVNGLIPSVLGLLGGVRNGVRPT